MRNIVTHTHTCSIALRGAINEEVGKQSMTLDMLEGCHCQQQSESRVLHLDEDDDSPVFLFPLLDLERKYVKEETESTLDRRGLWCQSSKQERTVSERKASRPVQVIKERTRNSHELLTDVKWTAEEEEEEEVKKRKERKGEVGGINWEDMGKCKRGVEGLRFNRRGVEWRSADLREAPAARRSFQTHREIASASVIYSAGGARSIVVVIAKAMPIKRSLQYMIPQTHSQQDVRTQRRAIHSRVPWSNKGPVRSFDPLPFLSLCEAQRHQAING